MLQNSDPDLVEFPFQPPLPGSATAKKISGLENPNSSLGLPGPGVQVLQERGARGRAEGESVGVPLRVGSA